MSWIQIQERTFTHWMNETLKARGMHVDDLSKDLANGLLLINLLEILSEKPLPKHNKNPRIPNQRYENTGIAMSFIKAQGIKTVNIGNTDITDGNFKIILGLIWTLILHYHVNHGDSDGGGKNELLEWVRSKIPEYDVKNFTKDWNDGRALCALTNAIAPNSCPGHWDLDKSAGLDNCRKGMDLAEERLGIPQVLDAKDMANPKVDEQSVMTYIQYFRDAVPRKINYADKCSAYGPGLVEGVANQPGDFVVKTPGPDCGVLEVKVFGPESTAEVEVKNNGNGTYDVQYHPTEPGEYKIHVTLDGDHIPGSVFTVVVLEDVSLGGEGKVRCFYTTTSSSDKVKKDCRLLQELLASKEVNLREDYNPDEDFIPIDVLERKDRNAVFDKAGTKELPIVLVDDVYVGAYDNLLELEQQGKLDALLNFRQNKPKKYVKAK